MLVRCVCFGWLFLVLIGCGRLDDNSTTRPDALFRLVDPTASGIGFRNDVVSTKDFNILNYRNFYNGGGVAIGDINNDGLPDVFFTSNQSDNKLYLNKGQLQFSDISVPAGIGGNRHWSTGVTMADVDGDGWLDIYVCNSGNGAGGSRNNQLFINQHNLTFKEMAAEYGLDDDGPSTHAAFFDYDNDGDLDCYILNNSYRPVGTFGYNRNLRNERYKDGDKLLKNENGHFVDVSKTAGIYGSEIGFGLGVTVGDVNGDNWPDIYVSNDFFERDYLYLNNKNGTFSEVIDSAMGHISLSSMGADMGDINNDGWNDIFSTDMLPEGDLALKTKTSFDNFDVFAAKEKNDFHHQFTRNMLQLNNGNGSFSEIGQLAGTYQTDWSWGSLIFDFDNDGWKDIFVSNGIAKDLTNQDFLASFSNGEIATQIKDNQINYQALIDKIPSEKIPNYAFLNQKNLRFKNSSLVLGLGTPGFSNGAAYGDLDNDGDLDLVINNENDVASVYENRSSNQNNFHYLRIKLNGSENNKFGIGASVWIYAGGSIILQQQMPARGFQSSVDYTMVAGLGIVHQVDSLRIVWPGNQMQTFKNLPVDTTLVLFQKDAQQHFFPPGISDKPLFTNVSGMLQGKDEHVENNYVDFDHERLIPKMISMEGPKCAVGDINNDGLDDIVVGAAKGDQVKILLQQTSGAFETRFSQAINATAMTYEDAGLCLSDVDGDQDLDLIIASGGNEPGSITSPSFQARLYLNDGKGNFTYAFNNLPPIRFNSSCVKAADVDGDGDDDLFIGGRSISGKYGAIPASYLLINNGKGVFKDQTELLAPQLKQLGMVTDAVWVDIDGDKKPELVVVGDWMPITILGWTGRSLIQIDTIPTSHGWWNTIKVADVNNDGMPDLIAGNLGVNTKFNASSNTPVKLYVNDFDNNGQQESILTYYKSDGISYPMPLKDELVAQLPFLRKNFFNFRDYAGKSIEGIFSKDQLNKSRILFADNFNTSILINKGNGKFNMQPLPIQAQFSPVYGINCGDYNNDGKMDILLAGNFLGVKPEIGGWDASYGQLFIGNGNGSFSYMNTQHSGFFIKGEARDMVQLKDGYGNSFLFVAMNNQKPYLFKRRVSK